MSSDKLYMNSIVTQYIVTTHMFRFLLKSAEATLVKAFTRL